MRTPAVDGHVRSLPPTRHRSWHLHDVVSFAVMLVPLIVAVGVRTVFAVYFAFATHGIGRIERQLSARSYIGRDILLRTV